MTRVLVEMQAQVLLATHGIETMINVSSAVNI